MLGPVGVSLVVCSLGPHVSHPCLQFPEGKPPSYRSHLVARCTLNLLEVTVSGGAEEADPGIMGAEIVEGRGGVWRADDRRAQYYPQPYSIVWYSIV